MPKEFTAKIVEVEAIIAQLRELGSKIKAQIGDLIGNICYVLQARGALDRAIAS